MVHIYECNWLADRPSLHIFLGPPLFGELGHDEIKSVMADARIQQYYNGIFHVRL